MASAWLEVDLGDGNPRRIRLPIDWAIYPGGWRCKLKSLNLSRLPEWDDDEEETAEFTPALDNALVARPRVQSTTRHDYEKAQTPPVLTGLIRPERPLPPGWDVPVHLRPTIFDQDPQDLSALLREFDVEDDVPYDDELDRALVAETRNDEGPNENQIRANRLIGNKAVVDRGELADRLVRIVGWPGVQDDHVRVQVVQAISGAIYSVAMDDLNMVDEESAQLVESLRSAARHDPPSWVPPRVPRIIPPADFMSAQLRKEAEASVALDRDEEVGTYSVEETSPDEAPELEPVTVEPDLPVEEPGPLPEQQPETDEDPGSEGNALAERGLTQEVTRVDDGSPFGTLVPGAVESRFGDGTHPFSVTKKIEDIPVVEVRTCISCGCTDDHACEGGCFWVGWNLCSRCQADHELVKPTEAEVAEQAAKGTEKLKAEAKALKRWKREELPGLLDLVKQGYDPATSVHFRWLTPAQMEELDRVR